MHFHGEILIGLYLTDSLEVVDDTVEVIGEGLTVVSLTALGEGLRGLVQ